MNKAFTRFEVIDASGRVLTFDAGRKFSVSVSVLEQDGGETCKVFVGAEMGIVARHYATIESLKVGDILKENRAYDRKVLSIDADTVQLDYGEGLIGSCSKAMVAYELKEGRWWIERA